jgi:ATP-dependent DNA helicase RecQ
VAAGLRRARGNIAADLRAEEGRALAFGNDPGWSEVLAPVFAAPDAAPDEELVRGVAAALKAWPWGPSPHLGDLGAVAHPAAAGRGPAARLAEVGSMELVEAVVRSEPTRHRRTRWTTPPPRRPTCSTPSSSVAADGSPLPSGPGLVFDDALRSGWTMTVVAEGLRGAGAGLVLPFVLWRRP